MKNWLSDIKNKELIKYAVQIENEISFDNFSISLVENNEFGPIVCMRFESKYSAPLDIFYFQFGELLLKEDGTFKLSLINTLENNFISNMPELEWINFVNKQNINKTINNKTYLKSYNDFISDIIKKEKEKQLEKINKKFKYADKKISLRKAKEKSLKILNQKFEHYEGTIKSFIKNHNKEELKKD